MRRGFTLVELLIAIVIIGVLTTGMLLSGSSAVSSAKALNIVNDLRVMKEAVLLLYNDSMDVFDNGTAAVEKIDVETHLGHYMDNPDRFTKDRYILATGDGNRWFVGYKFDGKDPDAAEIKESLTGRAKSTGLLSLEKESDKDVSKPYAGGDTVYMRAR